MIGMELVAAVRDDEKDAPVRNRLAQERQDGRGSKIGPVKVFDDADQRMLAGSADKGVDERFMLIVLRVGRHNACRFRRERFEQLEDGAIWSATEWTALSDRDASTRGLRAADEFSDQPRLADSGLAADEHDASMRLRKLAALIDEEAQFTLPSYEATAEDGYRDHVGSARMFNLSRRRGCEFRVRRDSVPDPRSAAVAGARGRDVAAAHRSSHDADAHFDILSHRWCDGDTVIRLLGHPHDAVPAEVGDPQVAVRPSGHVGVRGAERGVLGDVTGHRNFGDASGAKFDEPYRTFRAGDGSRIRTRRDARRKLGHGSARRDASDLARTELGEPHVPIGAADDIDKICVRRYSSGELGDDAARRDPPDLVRKFLREPHIAIRTARDVMDGGVIEGES